MNIPGHTGPAVAIHSGPAIEYGPAHHGYGPSSGGAHISTNYGAPVAPAAPVASYGAPVATYGAPVATSHSYIGPAASGPGQPYLPQKFNAALEGK